MKVAKIALIVIQVLVMLNAFGGGLYGLAGAKDIPQSWLDGSPFGSFIDPEPVPVRRDRRRHVGARRSLWWSKNRLAPWFSLGMGFDC